MIIRYRNFETVEDQFELGGARLSSLEGHFELIVTNAAHMKAVPGRKTEVEDAAWIAELLRMGCFGPASFPRVSNVTLWELTRHRSSLAGKWAQAANELESLGRSGAVRLHRLEQGLQLDRRKTRRHIAHGVWNHHYLIVDHSSTRIHYVWDITRTLLGRRH